MAHFSDLHLGAAGREQAVARAVEAALEQRVDHVVVTGDVTDSGQLEELQLFDALFRPLARRAQLTVVPGNHDRCGADVAELLSGGRRVSTVEGEGLFLVRVDSTAPHNASSYRSHGALCARTLDEVEAALADAPKGRLVAVLLHHHVVPLPVETLGEWLAEALGWPHASELQLGRELLRRALGRADLVMHGHRHVPRHFVAGAGSARPLHIYNAGSTAELGAFRLFTHHGGALAPAPRWVHATAAARRSPHTHALPPLALELA